jgi:hypothetical protein
MFYLFIYLFQKGNKITVPYEKNAEQGASTTIWASIAPELEDKGGLYCDDNSISIQKNSREEIFTNFTG